MQENLILAYYAQIWKFGPGSPKMEFFIFVEKSPDFSFNEPSTTPDIKFKSSYAIKVDFGLSCPNMEIQPPRLPKMEFFKKISFF